LASCKVFANIPYAITTAIVTRLTTGRAAPVDSYLIVQREAADRVIGSPRATLYAALLYPWFAAEIVHSFQPGNFRPVPKVESVLLWLHRRQRPLVPAADAQFYRDFVTFAFTASRPALQCTLRACLERRLADRIVRSERLNPAATPSMVPGTLWLLLFEHLKDSGGSRIVAGAEERLRDQQAGLRKSHRTRVRAARFHRPTSAWARASPSGPGCAPARSGSPSRA
jgi:16S rRNA A1518/A1519 N6-dimethyltransferase RsmA/KsgA/DIM1 with predicted DNA glycosylase/AP lyase activity